MAAMVQAVNLTQAYDLGEEQVYVLNGASLEINQGELLAIVGRPGSGKSTLLHILGCLRRPDSGRVRIEGLDVTRLDDEELGRVRNERIGFVFQAFNLLPKENVLGNVEVPLKKRGVDAWTARERAEEVLRYVGLGTRLDNQLGRLSLPQRQAVAIARAIAGNPAVIIADEPTRAMDSTSQEEVIGLLQKLNAAGRTVAIATTDPGVARYCTRSVKISGGLTEDQGPVSRRRIIPPSRIAGGPSEAYEREAVVCPRCSLGNFSDEEFCKRCKTPLHLTEDEEESIEGRVSGTDAQWLGPESDTDEQEEVTPGGLTEELAAVPIFSGLGSKSLLKVVPSLERREFSLGQEILKQGDLGDSFYIIRDGKVRVVLERGDDQGVVVAELGPREGFGEMALLTDQPRSATVTATTAVDTWRLSAQAFQALLGENLSLALYFNRILSQRLRTLQERIVP